MKKASFLSLSLVLVPFLVAAQSSGVEYLERSVQQSFNLDNVTAVLASPQFQIALVLVVGIVAFIWFAYLWGSFKMAYEDMEINIFRKLQWMAKTVKLPKIQAPNIHTDAFTRWNTGRIGFAPDMVTVDHKPAQEETKERGSSEPTRGETQEQAR